MPQISYNATLSTTNHEVKLQWKVSIPESTAEVHFLPPEVDESFYYFSEVFKAKLTNLTAGTVYQAVILPKWRNISGDYAINEFVTIPSMPLLLSVSQSQTEISFYLTVDGRFEVLTAICLSAAKTYFDYKVKILHFNFSNLVPGDMFNITAIATTRNVSSEMLVAGIPTEPAFVILQNQDIDSASNTTMTFSVEGVGFLLEYQVYDFSDRQIFHSNETFFNMVSKEFDRNLIGFDLHVRVLSHLSGQFAIYSIGIPRITYVNLTSKSPGVFEISFTLKKGLVDGMLYELEPDENAASFARSSSDLKSSFILETSHYGRVITIGMRPTYKGSKGARFTLQQVVPVKISVQDPIFHVSADHSYSAINITVKYYGFIQLVKLTFRPEIHQDETFGLFKPQL